MRRFLILGVAILAAASRVAAADITLVDTLGVATPTTTFSVFGSWGTGIANTQYGGPQFTLTEPTTITEIGGFVNNCKMISLGVPYCADARPFVVEIRPSTNGAPDPATVLATFPLSHDGDPLVVAFESVAPGLTLPAGTYFALFAPQGDDAGFLLAGAGDSYRAGQVTMGWLYDAWGTGVLVSSGNSTPHTEFYWGAARVLGAPATPEGRLRLVVATVEALASSGALAPEDAAGLTAKLDAALADLAEGRADKACNALGTFANKVNELVSLGRLPAETAQELLNDAQSAGGMIGCG